VASGGVTVLVRSRCVERCEKIFANKILGSLPVEGIARAPVTAESSHYYYIGSPEDEPQDAYYAVCLTYWLSGGEDEDLIRRSKDLLLHFRQIAKSYSAVALFGTGPSLAEVKGIGYRDSFNVICNTIVKNRELCEELQPKVVIAADAHFHFSYHQYSARLLADLAYVLNEIGAVFLTFDKFATFLKARLPFMADKVFGIPAGRKRYGFDFDCDFRVMAGDSVLNMFMLPIASFLSDQIDLCGFTGRAPNDSYFWAHSNANQYTDLMASVRSAHPAFFSDRDYVGYADDVDNQIALRVNHARAVGKSVTARTTTFYKAFQE
jgi:hypothetical protein